ncbi:MULTISPECIES: hypothetical protein [Corallococcus]|uniref:hypothetical protein n=1 Tax=Corallococcus TaxID=83461 RepID=UPI00118037C0|nr:MULTISPECIES: hypothetical protein [Corallococcus]NBD12602.1 hypothetical protein [Corallococcus silvisoli]TSC29539.1 hypothetical protein FOF48_16700 [Corallococcus sp. Z5C101001]
MAGRLLLRRAPVHVESGPTPAPWPPRSFDLEPVWWPDGEAPSTAAELLTREDVASQQEDGELDRAAPRIRRGPSGRERFWLEPGPSSRG